MVCIVPHFIIYLYNNYYIHTTYSAWLCMPQIGIWSDFKIFSKFINLQPCLNTYKRYVDYQFATY